MKENVEYIKVFADYESDDMPVIYIYEVDLEDERLALRAIEIFADRKVKCIEDSFHTFCGRAEFRRVGRGIFCLGH